MTNQYPTADEIRANVTRYLEELSVTFSADGGERITRDGGGKPWRCFQWSVTFKRTNTRFDTMYYTGLGRVQSRRRRNPDSVFYTEPKAQAPRAADVLYCLLSDADANSMSFKDWCSDYDYSEDSIKALNTYKECCDAAVKLSVIFSGANIEALREMLEGY